MCPSRRPRRSKNGPHRSRPAVEPLEGRALMAISALDPGFGEGGRVDENASATDVSSIAAEIDGGVATAHAGTATGLELVVLRYTAAGLPVAGFGEEGVVTVDPPTGVNGLAGGSTVGLVVEPDGSVVAAVAYTLANPPAGSPAGTTADETQVVRVEPDGTLDPKFGQGGMLLLTADDPALNLLAIQPDGKILAAGTARAAGDQAARAGVIRLDADGSVDATFDGGLARTVGSPGSSATGVASDPSSGKVVLAGSTPELVGISPQQGLLARVDADGSVDTAFGEPFVGDSTSPTAVAVRPDGKILVTASGYNGSALLDRYDVDGTYDSTFHASFPLPAYQGVGPTADSLAIQPDGKVLVAGTETGGSAQSYVVFRVDADGATDAGFGLGGAITIPAVPAGGSTGMSLNTTVSIALEPTGSIDLAGTFTSLQYSPVYHLPLNVTDTLVARLLPIALIRAATPGDYTGDGKTDPAVYLPGPDLYAYRPSNGAADVVQEFGIAGAGQTIPAPGDYNGDSVADVAVYLPSAGAFAIRPSGGGADEIVPFGFAGAGQTLPAAGDYDGDGTTDIAAYLPAIASFAIRPSTGGADRIVPFGFAGAGATIPAPGDYDGDGKTDVAAYLPSLGAFAIRPSGGGPDEIDYFGFAGAGASIPVPGDYDGSGRTEIAVYLPSLGELIYRPGGGGADVTVPFGFAGAGATIPAPGDYDGSGRTDVAAYLPSAGLFVYRPSGGGPDVVESFGIAGPGQAIPASSISDAGPGTVSAASGASGSARAEVIVPLTDDLMAIPGTARKKGAGAAG